MPVTEPLPAVFVGLDVGKSDHHAVVLTADGKTVLDTGAGVLEQRRRTRLLREQ